MVDSIGRVGAPMLVTALFGRLIRMQTAASPFAGMDEIHFIFAQIPHSKESMPAREEEGRADGAEAEQPRRPTALSRRCYCCNQKEGGRNERVSSDAHATRK